METLIQSQEIWTYTPSSYLNMVTINVRTHTSSGNINTVILKIRLYVQWWCKYSYNRETYTTPSGNINKYIKIIDLYTYKLINSYISTHAPSGNVNIFLEIHTYRPNGCLNTTVIEKCRHTRSGHIIMVSLNLTYILSDNLNTSASNKYTNTLSDNNQTVAIW